METLIVSTNTKLERTRTLSPVKYVSLPNAAGREYRVLVASVTYFKAHVSDQISIIIPEDNREAEWAAIEAGL